MVYYVCFRSHVTPRAAGRASMRAHMVACSSLQRAAGRASMRAYTVTYGCFRSLAARCIVLLGADGPPQALTQV